MDGCVAFSCATATNAAQVIAELSASWKRRMLSPISCGTTEYNKFDLPVPPKEMRCESAERGRSYKKPLLCCKIVTWL